MSIRMLIADDQEVVRTGLVCLMANSDVEIVAVAASAGEAVELADRHKPDVALLDIRMQDCDGLDALEQIRDRLPETRVIMLSAYDNPTYVARAYALGANDYLLKGCSREALLATIRAVYANPAPTEFGRLRHVADTLSDKVRPGDDSMALTQRELQVLRHLALGLSNKEIAQSLAISVETVKEHVQHLLRKLHVSDRTEAAVWALRQGLA